MTASAPTAKIQPAILWTFAFRPFFLAAGLWATFAILLWAWLYATGTQLPSHFDPLSWHIHEMLFGFTYAAIAGFLLTAIANWTGRPPIAGPLLGTLAGVWLLGRVVALVSAVMPLWLAGVIELLFPLLLAGVALREIIAGKNARNLKVPLPIIVLAIADLLMYEEMAGANVPAGIGWRLGICGLLALISLIGGRIIPAFTRNWLRQRGVRGNMPPQHGHIDTAALGLLQLGLLSWALFPYAHATGGLLLLAGVANLLRVSRWRGLITFTEPLMIILHLAYVWIGLGLILLGASIFTAQVPLAAAVHALTIGVIGTMILAIMPRVTLGHTGRPITADPNIVMAFVAIIAATIARLLAAFLPHSSINFLQVSSLFWAAGFGLFVWHYTRMLLGPRVDR